MKIKRLTIEELKENVWWWNLEKNRSEMERLKLFGYELTARNYELMRRSPNAVEYQANYQDLDRENKTIAAVAWGDPKDAPTRQVFDLQNQEELGWTSARPHLQWNLQLSDRVLKKAFVEYIKLHRNVQNMPSQSSLKGKVGNRPTSWLYIEYLDMKRNRIKGYDLGMASKAEKMTLKLLKEFKDVQIKRLESAKPWQIYCDFEGFGEGFEFK